MTSLVSIYRLDGLIGRCDARCYNAQQPHCDCVCGGKNHGRGIQVAAQNTINEAADWLEQAAPDGLSDRELYAKVARDLRQLARQTLIRFAPPPDPDHPYS